MYSLVFLNFVDWLVTNITNTHVSSWKVVGRQQTDILFIKLFTIYWLYAIKLLEQTIKFLNFKLVSQPKRNFRLIVTNTIYSQGLINDQLIIDRTHKVYSCSSYYFSFRYRNNFIISGYQLKVINIKVPNQHKNNRHKKWFQNPDVSSCPP